MHDMKNTKQLEELTMAALISEGDFISKEKDSIFCPLNIHKFGYLNELVKNYNLEDYVDINVKKGQFVIHSHPIIHTLYKQWYSENKKVFSFTLDPNLITLNSVIIAINLFGVRKLENISIPINTQKNHIKTLAYCLEQHLKVPVIPSTNQLKVINVPLMVGLIIKDIQAIHSAELLQYLTDKEKKILMVKGGV